MTREAHGTRGSSTRLPSGNRPCGRRCALKLSNFPNLRHPNKLREMERQAGGCAAVHPFCGRPRPRPSVMHRTLWLRQTHARTVAHARSSRPGLRGSSRRAVLGPGQPRPNQRQGLVSEAPSQLPAGASLTFPKPAGSLPASLTGRRVSLLSRAQANGRILPDF